MSVDEILGELNFPKTMNKYRQDFGGTDECLIRFVYNLLSPEPPLKLDTAIRKVCVS